MKSLRTILFLFTLIILRTDLTADQITLEDLLKCNLSGIDVAKRCNVDNELNLYQSALKDESNYFGMPSLESWIDTVVDYPEIHFTHLIVLNIIKELDISTICEIGAGAGKVSKYVYAQNPNLKLTCIEHNNEHLAQMKENFETRTNVLLPDIQVNAAIVKGCLPDLSTIKSNEFDLIFTCTVMMHIPYIPAIKSAKEIHRLTNKYILHVENKNEGNSWYNMTVVKPPALSQLNYLGINYVELYEKLGVKTLKYYEYKDPFSPATYIVYLGEKTDKGIDQE